MCRMAAFPPGTSAKAALGVLAEFFGENDGTGVAYVKDGTFVVHKYALALDAVVARKLPLLGHMPHNGWTIAHLRTASVGKVQRDNSHPFIKGDWAVCHNGTFTGDDLLRVVYKKMGFKFSGTTDSEVLAQTVSHLGFPAFARSVDDGAFFGLHRNGDLYVKVAQGADMEMSRTKHGLVLGSEIPTKYPKRKTILEGWMRLTKSSRKIAGKVDLCSVDQRYSRSSTYVDRTYGNPYAGGYYGTSETYHDYPKVGNPKPTVRTKTLADWDEDDYTLDQEIRARIAGYNKTPAYNGKESLVDAKEIKWPKPGTYRNETYMNYDD
jgi:hypothetical protein